MMHSANSGVVVQRVGQLRADRRGLGRRYARQLAGDLNTRYAGLATTVAYEETFGAVDRMHWFIHLASLDAYEDVLRRDRKEGAVLDRFGGSGEGMTVDGSLRETVLIPQSFGMYGTAEEKSDHVVREDGASVEKFVVPTAAHQSGQPEADLLHTGNCGLLMHRTGELRYEFRAEGRQFARALGQSWNAGLAGNATIFLYEEAFGLSDRIHWLIHLRSAADYYLLMGLRARVDPAAREIFTRQWIPEEKGGGGWERMFVQGSLRDVALTPLPEVPYPAESSASRSGV